MPPARWPGRPVGARAATASLCLSTLMCHAVRLIIVFRLPSSIVPSSTIRSPPSKLERRAIAVALPGQVWSYRCTDFNEGCSLRRPGPAYLDFMASTPVDPSVIDAVTDAMSHDWGNPHSDHAHGLQASKIVERSREALAALLGAGEDEILFTSGATEANNLAIKGIMSSAERRGNHLVVSSIEHKCVLEAARSLVESGIEVTEVRPGSNGRIRAEAIAQALRSDTALVSVMHANNETGVIQPVREIAEICHRQGVLFHTDAAQTVGKIDVDFTHIVADLLSFSGHKFYGPKGVGGLVVSRAARLRLVPQLDGGSQQPLGRSGTVPVPLCAGLAAAARLYERHGQSARTHIQSLQSLLEDRITRKGRPASSTANDRCDRAANGQLPPTGRTCQHRGNKQWINRNRNNDRF